VLTIDSDLNHDPEEIRFLLDAAKGAEIVVGSRSKTRGLVKELPWFKRMVSASTNWVLRTAFDIESRDITSGFRIYSVKAVESIREELISKNFEVTAELLIRAKKKGYSIVEVPITFTRRPLSANPPILPACSPLANLPPPPPTPTTSIPPTPPQTKQTGPTAPPNRTHYPRARTRSRRQNISPTTSPSQASTT